jgi:hypothetical protein
MKTPRLETRKAKVPKKVDKDVGQDLKTFERLPAKTKELLQLEEQAKKATGRKSMEINRMIRERSKGSSA